MRKNARGLLPDGVEDLEFEPDDQGYSLINGCEMYHVGWTRVSLSVNSTQDCTVFSRAVILGMLCINGRRRSLKSHKTNYIDRRMPDRQHLKKFDGQWNIQTRRH